MKNLFIFISFFFSSLIQAQQNSQPLILITGCGRSGTTYISRVFQKAGYDIKHEKEIGSNGTVSWKHLFKRDRNRNYQIVLHQIRHPLSVIASLHTAHQPSWDFISKRLPEYSKKDSLLVNCAKYWLFWNKKAESLADLSYPIEDLENYLDKINQLCQTQITKNHLYLVSDRANARGHIKLNWSDLEKNLKPSLYQEIIKYAAKWNYSVP